MPRVRRSFVELIRTDKKGEDEVPNAWTKCQGPEITLIFELRSMEIHGGLICY